MTKHRTHSKLNIPFCAGLVLLCLTLFSMHLTSGLYARYVTTDSADDAARVITFGDLTLTETGDFVDGSAIIVPGVDLTKRVVVSFTGSESATYTFIEVKVGKWMNADKTLFYVGSVSNPLMSWSVAEGWESLGYIDGSYVYYRADKANNNSFTCDFIASEGVISVSDSIKKSDLADMHGMFIRLQATVVQSNGFNNPSDAWASVSGKGA